MPNNLHQSYKTQELCCIKSSAPSTDSISINYLFTHNSRLPKCHLLLHFHKKWSYYQVKTLAASIGRLSLACGLGVLIKLWGHVTIHFPKHLKLKSSHKFESHITQANLVGMEEPQAIKSNEMKITKGLLTIYLSEFTNLTI